MKASVAFDPRRVAAGIARRLADLRAAMDRYGSFSFRPDEPAPSPFEETELPEAARALVLRALDVASDPVNHHIMQVVAGADTPLPTLAERCSLSRVDLWERIGDLVQTGLAARSLDGDRVGLSDAGRALLELIDELTDEVGRSSGESGG